MTNSQSKMTTTETSEPNVRVKDCFNPNANILDVLDSLFKLFGLKRISYAEIPEYLVRIFMSVGIRVTILHTNVDKDEKEYCFLFNREKETRRWDLYARQANGTVILCRLVPDQPDNRMFLVLKHEGDHAIEGLTQYHIQNKISTNVDISNAITPYPPTELQRDILNLLASQSDVPMEGILTPIPDKNGIYITLVPVNGSIGKWMLEIIRSQNENPLRSFILDLVKSGCPFVPIFSVSGSFGLFSGVEEQTQIVCDIFTALGISRVSSADDPTAAMISINSILLEELDAIWKRVGERLVTVSVMKKIAQTTNESEQESGTSFGLQVISVMEGIAQYPDIDSRISVSSNRDIDEHLQAITTYYKDSNTDLTLCPKGFQLWIDGSQFLFNIRPLEYYQIKTITEDLFIKPLPNMMLHYSKAEQIFGFPAIMKTLWGEIKETLQCGMMQMDKHAKVPLEKRVRIYYSTSGVLEMIANTFFERFRANVGGSENMKIMCALIKQTIFDSRLFSSSELKFEELFTGDRLVDFYRILFPKCAKLYKDEIIVRFGCPKSTDLDVALLRYGTQKQNLGPDLEHIKQILEEAGIEISDRKIDYVILTLGEFDFSGIQIMGSSKGSTMTIHIINNTLDLHKQIPGVKHLFPLKSKENVTTYDQSEGLIKYLFQELKFLVESCEYSKLREKRGSEYDDPVKRRETVMSLEDLITNSCIEGGVDACKVKGKADTLKSLTVKLLQLMLNHQANLGKAEEEFALNDAKYYIKESLAELSDEIIPESKNFALFHLFRGSQGEFNPEYLPALLKMAFEIFRDCRGPGSLSWKRFILNTEHKFQSDDVALKAIIDEFLCNPVQLSKKLHELIKAQCPNGKLGDVFTLLSGYWDVLGVIPAKKLKRLRKMLLMMDQRSKKWSELHKMLRIGAAQSAGTHVGADWIDHYQSLIVGSLVEIYITNMFCQGYINPFDDKNDKTIKSIKMYVVGFLVDCVINPTRGIAPDMIIVVEHENGHIEMIPVEIKTLTTDPGNDPNTITNNRIVRRDIRMATVQCQTASDIIRLHGFTVEPSDYFHNRSLLVNAFIKTDHIDVRCAFIKHA
jgi:hypothetical protein